jgi:nicotinate phosphoribosyltransferase
MRSDLLGLREEARAGEAGEPLLAPVMRGGQRLSPRGHWREAKERFGAQLASLPEECRRLEAPQRPPVEITPALTELQRRTQARFLNRSGHAL